MNTNKTYYVVAMYHINWICLMLLLLLLIFTYNVITGSEKGVLLYLWNVWYSINLPTFIEVNISAQLQNKKTS